MRERFNVTVDQVVKRALRKTDSIHVVLTPLVWQPDGRGGKRWYFVIATSEKGRGFRADEVVVTGPEDRAAILVALLRRPPLVVHDCDDELVAARLCETLWPGERITSIRRQVEAEREAFEATLQ